MEEKVVVIEERPFEFLVNAVLAIEKLRVAAQVRQTHLKKQKRKDRETDELLKLIVELEKYADSRVARLIQEHPAYPWFSRVKGVGKENIAKVVGMINVEKAETISSLWKFSGFHVVNGKAPKRVRGGGKLEYNSRLRSMCWRLAISILKAGIRQYCVDCGEQRPAKNNDDDSEVELELTCECGSKKFDSKPTSKFAGYYLKEKEKYIQGCLERKVKIVPTSQLPKNKDGKRYEPEGVISEGHIHNMALRKMIKLFLACLWLAWREAVSLPTRKPYSHEHQGHTKLIDHWEMMDK